MGVADLLYGNPLYGVLLTGPVPRRLARLPPAPWGGDPAKGAAILAGSLRCAGQTVQIGEIDWRITGLRAEAIQELHGFRWLDDLAAVGDERSSTVARRLISSWIDRHSQWAPQVWAPEVLGARIAAWLSHARFLARGDDDPVGARILESLARQVRHLARAAGGGASGFARLVALRGLIYGTACGLGPAKKLEAALRLLTRELGWQVLADGGHIERSPSQHIEALAALVDIRGMLLLAQREPPTELGSAIDRMAPIARFYRHGDGRLALFNGTAEGDAARIDAILGRADARGQAPESAARTGFERIVAGQTLVLMDTGTPAPQGFDRCAHAGTLSFEMSCGRERLIVNCGAGAAADPAWRRAQRATAAHSTVAVDDTNSSALIDDGGVDRRPEVVECRRETADGNVWVTASHDGYRPNFGLVHKRRLYLSGDGADLRGEDSLAGGHRGSFVLRFHLHPEARASLIQNGAAVLMRLPSGSAWRLQANAGKMEVTESVYLGGAEPRRTEQVAISGALEGDGAQIKWAVKRVPPN